MSQLAGVKVLLRADASLQIGTGHVMRCLTLAEELRRRGASCRFASRVHGGHHNDAIRGRGFEVVDLPVTPDAAPTSVVTAHDDWLGSNWRTDARQTAAAWRDTGADWLVVDHYALEAGWERALRANAPRLLAIDDLADRAHDCDVLLDQNLGRQVADYAGHVGAGCEVLAGPRFALLRPEFAALRASSLQRRREPALDRLLVTMGGVDAANATGAVLDALRGCRLPASLEVIVVMGSRAPALAAVRESAARQPWHTEVRVDVSDMAALMRDSDLVIGAAGSTAWERCCLGLPSIAVALAFNQRAILRALQQAGAALALDFEEHAGPQFNAALAAAVAAAAKPRQLKSLGAHAAVLVDGLGVERVADVLARHMGRS